MIFKILILIALLQLLYKTENPFLCSGIYAAVVLVSGLIFGGSLLSMLGLSVLVFALATLYFWLLNEFKDGALHWGIMIGGLLLGLV